MEATSSFLYLIMSWLIGLYNLDGSFYIESYVFNSEVQWVSSAELSVQQFQRKASICYVCNCLLKNPSRVSSHLKKKITGLIKFDTDIENACHNRKRMFCHKKSDQKDRPDMLTNKLTLEFLLKAIQVFLKHFKSMFLWKSSSSTFICLFYCVIIKTYLNGKEM